MPLRLYPRTRHRSARQSRRPAWAKCLLHRGCIPAAGRRCRWRRRRAGRPSWALNPVVACAAPQLVVLGTGPARRDGAVDQAPGPGPGRWPRPQSARTSPPRPARSARLATKLDAVGGEISRESARNSCEQFYRKYMRSRSLGTTHTISVSPCSTARSTPAFTQSVCCGSDR
jgi:hypothetical protein